MPAIMGRKPNDADRSTYRGRFAANLRSLRLAKFESQEDLSKAMARHGYRATTITISAWERGTRTPPIEAFPALAKSLHCDPGDLLPGR